MQKGDGDNEPVYQEGGRHVNEQAVLIQDVDEGQIVSGSDLVVVMVVGWGDFDGTWAASGGRGREKKRERSHNEDISLP